MATVVRVTATPEALAVIERLQAAHGSLMFYQSSGCCDGSSPMCLVEGEMLLSPTDIRLGEIGGVGFHMSPSQFAYWQHAQLTVDVVKGHGDSFSLESSLGLCFVTRSRLFTDEETAALAHQAVPQFGLHAST
ncbi:hypothetical protein EV672_101297 [Aquabacterium commune]|uniref:DUF779 domain-containing protein n=1 Tax=Aquabacterium commune TaxID=70586 RepID=A0A4R6RN79_9BURK|nr:DUF779 domain-containing protein [Aquabacterium commune]TDP88153.1 hypothetical protein EV672_101297 [Aquabacterium commune]